MILFTLVAAMQLGLSSPEGLPAPLLTLEQCDLDDIELRRLINIEMGGRFLQSGAQVRVRCESDIARISVRQNNSDEKLVHTNLDLVQAPPMARNRIVALAVSDLLAWAQPVAHKAPAALPVPVTSAASPAAIVASPRILPRVEVHRSKWRFGAAGQLRSFFSADLQLWGVAPSVVHERDNWGQEIELSVLTGSEKTRFADVGITSGGLAVAAWWRYPMRWTTLRAGLGGRLAYLRLSGEPVTGEGSAETFSAVVASPFVLVGLLSEVSKYTTAELRLQSGHLLSPVVALIGDREQVKMAGTWVGISVVISFLIAGGG